MTSSYGVSTATAARPAVTTAPPEFSVERRRGRIGPLSVGHVVVLEVVAVVLIGALAADRGHPGLWSALAAVVSAVALAGAFGRARGGWWYERRALRGRWRRRRRGAQRALAAQRSGEPPLAALAAGLVVREVLDRGNRIGVGQDENGWFAVLSVGPRPGVWGEPGDGVRLDRLAGLLTDATVPVSSISVVTQAVPAPNPVLDRQSRAFVSYRNLLQHDGVLAAQAVWVAVRLVPADAVVAAAARGGGLTGVDRALVAALGRVSKTLAGANLPLRPLDPAALREALATSSGLAAAGGTPTGSEDWTARYAGGVGHVGFWLSRWPKGPLTDLFTALTQVPAALVSLAVTVYPPGPDGQLPLACLVRVAAEPDVLAKAASEVVSAARQSGARLRRLDGEHGVATYATLPTAAGVR